jgi:hypothetical protein
VDRPLRGVEGQAEQRAERHRLPAGGHRDQPGRLRPLHRPGLGARAGRPAGLVRGLRGPPLRAARPGGRGGVGGAAQGAVQHLLGAVVGVPGQPVHRAARAERGGRGSPCATRPTGCAGRWSTC